MYPSIIRTVVPMVVAVVLGQAARIGLDLDEAAVTSFVTVAIGTVFYAGVRWLEERWPVVGRLLGSSRAPHYPKPAHLKAPRA